MTLRLPAWMLVLAVLLGTAGCSSVPDPGGEPSVAVHGETALTLRRRAEGFYLRLAYRRFNTLETFNDRIMREHFRSDALFLDYYADLAEGFREARFDKRRPLRIEILSLRFGSPDEARVTVRFLGDTDRPLLPGEVELLRTDRWRHDDGSWWIEPQKL